jgi:hypothetical protein
MSKIYEASEPVDGLQQASVISAINECLGKAKRLAIASRHIKPGKFKADNTVDLQISFDIKLHSVKLYYRHVNQGERYENIEMKAVGNSYRATIPATYTNSQYPLAYYFELRESPGSATLYPGFGVELKDQPYFLLQQRY